MAAPAESLRKRRPKWWVWTKRVSAFLALVTLIGLTWGQVRFAFALKDASEQITDLPDKIQAISGEPTRIFSADGKVMFTLSREFREPVTLREVPKQVVDAILAAEDKRFYVHNGVDYQSIGRVLWNGGHRGGGSTLTMQLAKRMYTGPERSLDRKLHDIAIAVTMEREMTKPQILELYLNEVYYGSGAFGIKAAAHVYFHKELSQLTVADAALIARCVRSPSRQNPFIDLKHSIANRNDVLAIMAEEGMISRSQYQKALHEKPKLAPRGSGSGAKTLFGPYAVMHILDVLHDEFPDVDLSTAGFQVYTTIDSRMQRLSERYVREIVRKYRNRKITTGAFVLMDRDGRIAAEVGGVNFSRNQYSMIFQGKRQPGSSFKPIVYSAALEEGILQPDEMISNSPFTYTPDVGKPWTPQNDHGYGPPVTIERAIASSINVPAVRVMQRVTPPVVIRYAHEVFGMRSDLAPYLPLALGATAVSPLEMAEAYSVFMLHGDRATPFIISRVVGPDGNVVRSYEPAIVRGVLSGRVCDLMQGYLRAVVTSGTGTKANVVPDARGKTGTTSDNRDAWFCGYANGYLGVGWVGNEQPDPSGKGWIYPPMASSVFGGTVTVEIWAKVLSEVPKLADRPEPQTESQLGPQVEIQAKRMDVPQSGDDPNQEDPPMDADPVEDRPSGPVVYRHRR